jgi:hypothetical protein
MHEFTEDIDRFAINPSDLLRFGFQLLTFFGTAASVVVEFTDEALLP